MKANKSRMRTDDFCRLEEQSEACIQSSKKLIAETRTLTATAELLSSEAQGHKKEINGLLSNFWRTCEVHADECGEHKRNAH